MCRWISIAHSFRLRFPLSRVSFFFIFFFHAFSHAICCRRCFLFSHCVQKYAARPINKSTARFSIIFFPSLLPISVIFNFCLFWNYFWCSREGGGKKSEGLGISPCSYSFSGVRCGGGSGRRRGEGAYDDSAGGVGLRCFRMDGGGWDGGLGLQLLDFLYAV